MGEEREKAREKERERERERHWERFVPLFYAFIFCFLYVPWPKIKPATLAYQDDALTNWTTWSGQEWVHFEAWGSVQVSVGAQAFSGFMALLCTYPDHQTIFCCSWIWASPSLTCGIPCGCSAILAPRRHLPSPPHYSFWDSWWKDRPTSRVIKGQLWCDSQGTLSHGSPMSPGLLSLWDDISRLSRVRWEHQSLWMVTHLWLIFPLCFFGFLPFLFAAGSNPQSQSKSLSRLSFQNNDFCLSTGSFFYALKEQHFSFIQALGWVFFQGLCKLQLFFW